MSSARRWRKPRSWPGRSHPAPRRSRRPRSWPRPLHLGGGGDAESSPGLVGRGDADAKAIPSAGDPLLAPARVLACQSRGHRPGGSGEPSSPSSSRAAGTVSANSCRRPGRRERPGCRRETGEASPHRGFLALSHLMPAPSVAAKAARAARLETRVVRRLFIAISSGDDAPLTGARAAERKILNAQVGCRPVVGLGRRDSAPCLGR